MNGVYLRGLDPRRLRRRLRAYLADRHSPLAAQAEPGARGAAGAGEDRDALGEFEDFAGFLFGPVGLRAGRRGSAWPARGARRRCSDGAARRSRGSTAGSRRGGRRGPARRGGDAGAEAAGGVRPVRVALTGRTVSPGLFESSSSSAARRRWSASGARRHTWTAGRWVLRRGSAGGSAIGGWAVGGSAGLRCWIDVGGGSIGGVVVGRFAATSAADGGRCGAPLPVAQNASLVPRCARRATPPSDMETASDSTILLCCSGSRSPALFCFMSSHQSPYAPSSLRGRARSRFHNWLRESSRTVVVLEERSWAGGALILKHPAAS